MRNMVKYLRRSAEFDMTQDELAEAVGVSRATISAIENGATPSLTVGMKIAKVFGKELSEIFFEDDVAHSLQDCEEERSETIESS